MKKLLFATLAVIIVLSSCKTGSNFTSRKYTKGQYLSQTYKKSKLKVVESTKETTGLLASADAKRTFKVSPAPVILDKSVQTELLPVTKNDNKISFKEIKSVFIGKKQEKTSKVVFVPLLLTKKSQNNAVTAKNTSGESEGKFDVGALLGMIFGIVGLALGSIGFSLFGLTAVYFVFFVLGLVFGILGLVFGAKGMSRYKNNKHWSSLVFGIVGLVTGILSMLLALYYAVVTVIWLIANA